MKKRSVYVYSSLNGALTQKLFKKVFEVQESSALPPIGLPIRPGYLVSNYGELGEGVVTHAENKDVTQVLGVAMPGSTKELQELLIPEGWEEVSSIGK